MRAWRASAYALVGAVAVTCTALVAALGTAATAGAATSEVIDRSALRVCADPANMPFSNRRGEGFENKIAEVLAAELGVPVRYTWFPQATGFVRQTLRARRCDLIVGISLGFELLQNTNPYYRSAYVMIYREDSGLSATALDDPALKEVQLGIVAGTPPANLLARNGLLGNVRPYHLMVDTRVDSPGKQMVEDVATSEIDVAIVWGPIGGHYAKQQEEVPLRVVPLVTKPDGVRMDYRITMGVRFNEPEWKRELNALLKAKQEEIDAILHDYGVPLLDEQGAIVPPPEKRSGAASPMPDSDGEADEHDTAAAVPEPEGYRMEPYRAPVPATLEGGRVVDALEVEALYDAGEAILVDVMFRPQKPAGLKEGTIWRQPPRDNIPGSVWLPNTGYGILAEAEEAYFRTSLETVTGGDLDRPLVIYCKADCWMSWNAAKRAISYGYRAVHWFPDGTDGWDAELLPLAKAEPYLPGGATD